jgi:cytochrome c-type biogenesis protein CcmH
MRALSALTAVLALALMALGGATSLAATQPASAGATASAEATASAGAATSAGSTPATLTAARRGAVTARTSLPAIERKVMCVTCKIPLMVANSPQADRERTYIRQLIREGRTAEQIEHALVGQYGPAVLGLPRARGFDLTAYLVPLAAMLALLATLALLLPRWRRRTRERQPQTDAALTPADADRLDADLARFDR